MAATSQNFLHGSKFYPVIEYMTKNHVWP